MTRWIHKASPTLFSMLAFFIHLKFLVNNIPLFVQVSHYYGITLRFNLNKYLSASIISLSIPEFIASFNGKNDISPILIFLKCLSSYGHNKFNFSLKS